MLAAGRALGFPAVCGKKPSPQNVLFWSFNPQPGDGVALKAGFCCPVSTVLSTHSVRLDMLVVLLRLSWMVLSRRTGSTQINMV